MKLEDKVRWAENLKLLASAIFSMVAPVTLVVFTYNWGPEGDPANIALWAAVIVYVKMIAIAVLAQVAWYWLSMSVIKEIKKEEEKLESEALQRAKETSETKGYH